MKSITSFITDLIPHHKLDLFGKEDLLMTSLPYYLPFVLSIIFYEYVLFERAWVGVFIIYTFFPLLDEVFKLDLLNPN